MFINEQTYRGDIENDAVITALCAGFADSPKKCHELMTEVDKRKGLKPSWIGNLTILSIILSVLLVLLGVLFGYRK